jgi:hypothetical protein
MAHGVVFAALSRFLGDVGCPWVELGETEGGAGDTRIVALFCNVRVEREGLGPQPTFKIDLKRGSKYASFTTLSQSSAEGQRLAEPQADRGVKAAET